MKKILLVIVLALSISYYFIDKKLYLYGRSFFDIYNTLPYDIKPCVKYNDFEMKLILADKNGFTIAGEGVSYFSDTTLQKEIIRYRFDKAKIILEIIDVANNTKFVQISQLKSVNNLNSEIEAKDIKINTNFTNWEWIEVKKDKEKIEILVCLRNYCFLAIDILMFLVIMLIYKERKIRTKN